MLYHKYITSRYLFNCKWHFSKTKEIYFLSSSLLSQVKCNALQCDRQSVPLVKFKPQLLIFNLLSNECREYPSTLPLFLSLSLHFPSLPSPLHLSFLLSNKETNCNFLITFTCDKLMHSHYPCLSHQVYRALNKVVNSNWYARTSSVHLWFTVLVKAEDISFLFSYPISSLLVTLFETTVNTCCTHLHCKWWNHTNQTTVALELLSPFVRWLCDATNVTQLDSHKVILFSFAPNVLSHTQPAHMQLFFSSGLQHFSLSLVR